MSPWLMKNHQCLGLINNPDTCDKIAGAGTCDRRTVTAGQCVCGADSVTQCVLATYVYNYCSPHNIVCS